MGWDEASLVISMIKVHVHVIVINIILSTKLMHCSYEHLHLIIIQ